MWFFTLSFPGCDTPHHEPLKLTIISQIVSTIFKGLGTSHLLHLDGTAKIRSFLHSQFEAHGGAIGWGMWCLCFMTLISRYPGC